MPTLVTLVVVNPTNSTVERIDYSNDTATASPKGPLSVAREQLEQQQVMLPLDTLVVDINNRSYRLFQ